MTGTEVSSANTGIEVPNWSLIPRGAENLTDYRLSKYHNSMILCFTLPSVVEYVIGEQ